MTSPDWVPDACTLPTADRPLRRAEFDSLPVLSRRRVAATTLRWDLDPTAEATARDLISRESNCCSFFTFSFHRADGTLHLDIEVPPDHIEVLDALAEGSAGVINGQLESGPPLVTGLQQATWPTRSFDSPAGERPEQRDATWPAGALDGPASDRSEQRDATWPTDSLDGPASDRSEQRDATWPAAQ